MVVEARQIIAIVVAFVAPFIYFSASNNPSLSLLASSSSSNPLSATKDVPPSIRRLQQYLRIQTDHPTPDYSSAIQFLNTTFSTLLPHYKLSVLYSKNRKPTLLATLPGTSSSLPSILLNSHMDVVPVESEKWSSKTAPFSATLLNSRIYARGSQDMKSIGMQYIEALASLFETSWRPTRTIHLSFVSDEEIGGSDGMGSFVSSEDFTNLNVGVALDEGEPSPSDIFNVFYGERRPWWFSITVTGPPGHGATLPASTAAQTLHTIIGRALKFRDSQLELEQNFKKDIGDIVSVNIVYLDAGSRSSDLKTYAMNIIPSTATAGFDLRIPSSISQTDMETEIQSWMACNDGEKCPNVTLNFIRKVMGSDVTSRDPIENPFIDPFGKGMDDAGIGQSLKHGTFFASSDSRFLRAKGIPCFGFSPIRNTMNLMHKHDEYISVDGYMDGIDIYKSIIKQLADFDPEGKQRKMEEMQISRQRDISAAPQQNTSFDSDKQNEDEVVDDNVRQDL